MSADFTSRNFHKIVFIPYANLSIRLDRERERRFNDIVRKKFSIDPNCPINRFIPTIRRAKYYQIEARNEKIDYHRMIRLWSSGGVGFVSQVGKGSLREESLGDMIVDFIFCMRLYKKLLEDIGHYGKIYLHHEVSIGKAVKMMANMPHADGGCDEMIGIKLGTLCRDGISIPKDMDFSILESPEELIADNFLEFLRELYQSNIDFEKLLENVRGAVNLPELKHEF